MRLLAAQDSALDDVPVTVPMTASSAAASVIQFDAGQNCYRVGGQPYPRVTTVLRSAGLMDYSRAPEQKLADAQWRGSAVHLACQYLDEGTLDWSSIEREHLPYVRAWQRFRDESGFVVEAAEKCVFSRSGYAGRLDRLGRLRDGSLAVLDLKTGSVMPATRLQLAAYVMCLERSYAYSRHAVRLTPEGRFSVTTYPRRELAADFAVFLHALALYNWRKENC
jgi:hypothetical protein